MSDSIAIPTPPAFADPEAFVRIGSEIAARYPGIPNRWELAAALQSMVFVDEPPADGTPGLEAFRFVQLLIARPGARYARFDATKVSFTPVWALRELAEIRQGDLVAMPDESAITPMAGLPMTGTLFQHVRSQCATDAALLRDDCAPLPDPEMSLGITEKADRMGPAWPAFLAHLALATGRRIHRRMRWVCTDGDITACGLPDVRGASRFVIAIRHGDGEPAFFGTDAITVARDGQRWLGNEPRPDWTRRADGTPDTDKISLDLPAIRPDEDFHLAGLDEPAVWQRRMDMTVDEALGAAARQVARIRSWAGPTGGAVNLGRALAAPFMRTHPQEAYVFDGPGGTGKSTLAKALLALLGDQGMTLSLDLLTQPTAMSAENAMGDLMSHLLAVSDDYDPTHGRFEKVLPPLKTLLTGLLPFAARRRGCDSVQGRPQAVHLITTNSVLPLSAEESEQRRFAFAVIAHPIRPDLIAIEHGLDGGWPTLMLASALMWADWQGWQDRSVVQWTASSDLSDDELDVITRVAADGEIPGADLTAARLKPKTIGLVRRQRRAADGSRHAVYVPAPEDSPLHGIWMSRLEAATGVPVEEAEPEPESSSSTLTDRLQAAAPAESRIDSAPAPTDPLASSLTDVAALLNRAAQATEEEARHE